MNDHSDHAVQTRHAIDAVMAPVVLGSFLGYLPTIAAFLGIVWYLLQIYDWFARKWRQKKHHT